jgi:hypothetical protein
MKRFLVVPIMLLYMLAVSGVLIHAHYCGDELESWDVYQQAEGCAGGECGDETEENNDCCQDKVIAAKVSIDQKQADSYKFLTGYEAVADDVIIPLYPDYQRNYLESTGVTIAHRSNAPPGLWQGIPLYKLHGRFTYYG